MEKVGRRIRVLHLLNTATFSGAENVAISIIRGLSDSFEFAYASLDGPIRSNLTESSIHYIPLIKVLPAYVRQAIREYKPDIVHAHDYRASLVSAACCCNVPVISHIHNNVPWAKTYHPYSFMYMISSLKYSKILNVSESVLNEYVFKAITAKKTQVISNPVDSDLVRKRASEAPNPQSKYDLVFLGRLAVEKNPIRFIGIVNEVVKHCNDVRVAIIGDGHLKEECESEIKRLDLSNHISMLGFIHNPYAILLNANALCMTSSWEGFGLVAFEALALGVPVVATPVGGLLGIVDNECGLLTNDDSKYIEEVVMLLKQDDYRNMKSRSAFKRAEFLDNSEIYMNNIRSLYNGIIAK